MISLTEDGSPKKSSLVFPKFSMDDNPMVFFFQHQVDKVVFEKGPKDAEACRVALGQLRPSLRWVGFRVLAFGGNRRCVSVREMIIIYLPTWLSIYHSNLISSNLTKPSLIESNLI